MPGRQIPLIVASQNTTSNATGVVSAATALLVETQQTHPNTSGNFFATQTETMKAVLLTGAFHAVGWSNNPSTTGPTRGITDQPLDDVVGVGTVNVDRSYVVLTGGQHQSSTSTSGLIAAPYAGWETATLSSNQSKYIRFDVSTLADEVSILTTWHQKSPLPFSTYSLVNIDIELFKLTKGGLQPITGDAGLNVFSSGNVVSQSDVDNVEHLYISDLAAGEYVLKVARTTGWN